MEEKKTISEDNLDEVSGGLNRAGYDAICANCGGITKVPFPPIGDRPVYCKECFEAMEEGRSQRRHG